MSDGVRVVLLKPGDVLLIGNVGQLGEDAVDALNQAASQLRSALDLAGVALFEGDIDLSAMTPTSTEATRDQQVQGQRTDGQ